MNRKNIIIISAVANAALLLILFISAVVSRDDRKAPSSVEVASAILEKNPDGMILLPQESENMQKVTSSSSGQTEIVATSSKELVPLAVAKEPVETQQAESPIVHKLPETAQEVVLVNPSQESVQNNVEKKPSEKKEKESFTEVVVKKGDSLDKLARRYQISVRELKKVNNLEGSFLKVGKNLRIPLRENASEKSDAKERESSSPAEESGTYYVIKHGDNPWTVAIKHHMKVEKLLQLNHMTKEKAKQLRPGDKLRIR